MNPNYIGDDLSSSVTMRLIFVLLSEISQQLCHDIHVVMNCNNFDPLTFHLVRSNVHFVQQHVIVFTVSMLAS